MNMTSTECVVDLEISAHGRAYEFWHGQRLRSTRECPLALDAETEPIRDERQIPALALATASDGKVTLWGTAATAAERNRAARAAGKVDGVKAVENKIAVVKGS